MGPPRAILALERGDWTHFEAAAIVGQNTSKGL
jgi:hypothetical protein